MIHFSLGDQRKAKRLAEGLAECAKNGAVIGTEQLTTISEASVFLAQIAEEAQVPVTLPKEVGP